MPDPRWTGPPEQVALIFEAGNPASVIANNAVWVAESAAKELAAGLSTAGALATGAVWQGVGAGASLMTNTGLNACLHTLVGWAAHKIGVTQAAAEAFSVATSSVIPSVVSQTNRDEWAVLNATNFLGINTAAIVERDIEYFGEHWPHNSGVGWAYSGALTALTATLAVPPPLAPMGASPAAAATAGEAVADAAAQTGMDDAVQVSSQAGHAVGSMSAAAGSQVGSLAGQPASMLSSVTEPVQQMVQAPMQALQSMGSLPQGLVQSMTGMFPGAAETPNAPSGGAIAEPVSVGGGGEVRGSAAGAAGTFPGAGLTSYIRPAGSFDADAGGRPTSLRAGLLNAAEVRGGPVSTAVGGAPMPLSRAGMLTRGTAEDSDKSVNRARVVVGGSRNDPAGPR